jgi:demethylmenaquinone methyltransferase/2-methoxy-6-polyprenyl-1,4-benzoquinol methylase
MELDLREHVSSKEKKQTYVNRLFETIAPRYDFFTAFMSYGMDRGWKRALIEMLNLVGDETTLDLACGTGDITFAIAEHLESGHAAGLDITQAMLDIAEKKRRARTLYNLSFHRGDILKLPFRDSSFEYVTGGYALRNVPDINDALDEIKRVLKPGGRFFSLDFGHPVNNLYRWLYMRYLIIVGSAVGLVLHRDSDTYRYIPESLRHYPGQRGVLKMMDGAGFVETGFREFGGGIMAINYGMKPHAQ